MTESYPDHETYRKLYQRYYVKRDADELLQLAQPLMGASVLDICGGDGRLAVGALSHGAQKVVLLDAAHAMIPAGLRDCPNVHVHMGDVRQELPRFDGRLIFDCAVCRQAVNYWLNERTARHLANVMVLGGRFAFNTFNKKPPEKPRVLQYGFDGYEFTEVSWVVDETVYHVQVREGLPPHHTAFQWISPARIRELLEPYFEVREQQDGNTSLYQCIKK